MSGLGLSLSVGEPKEVMRDLTRDKVRPSNVRDLCRFMIDANQSEYGRMIEHTSAS